MKLIILTIALQLALVVPASSDAASNQPITVVSYYFGNYHPGDPRNVKTKGADWSEWELVKNAKPRFPGHSSPMFRCGAIRTNPIPKSWRKKSPKRRRPRHQRVHLRLVLLQ